MAAATDHPIPSALNGPVVVFVQSDDAPLVAGLAWARRIRAPLHLVTAFPSTTGDSATGLTPGPSYEEQRMSARRRLRERIDRLAPEVEVKITVVDGEPETAPLALVEHMTPRPQLLVIGQASSFWRRLFGQDPLQTVLSRAPVSVLAAASETNGPVVAAARSLDELRVAAFAAAAEATRRGAELQVLHLSAPRGADMPAPLPTALGLAPTMRPEGVETPAVDPVEEALGRLGRQAEVEELQGATPKSLADALEERGASLLVITERESSRVDQFLAPPEAPAIARRAPCSVLVVRPELSSS